jgi:predicted transcriptional regulator
MNRKVSIVVDPNGAKGFFERVREHARALDRSEIVREESLIAFEDPADLLSMLTGERIRLLGTLKEVGALQISDLAEALGRNKRAVSRDVSALRDHGLVATRYVVNAGHGRNLVVSPVAKKLRLVAAI